MNPRLGGALLALAAVALFVVSLATSAWWNGHPSVDGKVREIKVREGQPVEANQILVTIE